MLTTMPFSLFANNLRSDAVMACGPCLVGCVLMFATAFGTTAQELDRPPPVTVYLEVIDPNNDPHANFTITNVQNEDVCVAEETVGYDGRILSGALFKISSNGAPVAYKASHGDSPVVSFIVLAPGESLRSSIRLSDYYDFPREGRQYEIYYQSDLGYYHVCPKNWGEIRSNTVTFIYDNRPWWRIW